MSAKRVTIVLAVATALLLLGGQTLFAGGTSEKKVRNFAFFIPHQGNAFMAGLAKNMVQEGKALGVSVKVYTADNDPAKQSSQVDDAIAQKVDGVMLEPGIVRRSNRCSEGSRGCKNSNHYGK